MTETGRRVQGAGLSGGSPEVRDGNATSRRPEPRTLLTILGLGFGLAVTVGNTIGAGILRTPGDVAAWLPNPWLFVGIWIVGAAYAFLGANALAELGTMLPRTGAQYVYARHAFGPYAGFVVGWNDWISTCASAAAMSIVIGESLVVLLAPGTGMAPTFGMAVVAGFALLLWRGTSLGDRTQKVTSLVKAVALLALVAACFAMASRAELPVTTAQVVWTGSAFAGTVLAAQAVIYTYDGWTGSLYFAEEMKNPAREIPRSMFGSLALIAVIYVLLNVAFIQVLPPEALAGSPLAAGTVAQALAGQYGDTIVRVIVVLSLPSAVNACLMMASRVMFAVSRDELGVPRAKRVNRGGTPAPALFLSAAVAIAFLATGTFYTVIAVAAFFFVANYTLSFLAVFVLRRREPDAPRPYRAKGHPWTTGVVLVGSLAFLGSAIASDTRNSLYALVIFAVSYPVYRLITASRRQPPTNG